MNATIRAAAFAAAAGLLLIGPPSGAAPEAAGPPAPGLLERVQEEAASLFAVEARAFNHAMFTGILARYVKDGGFDYAALRGDGEGFLARAATSTDRSKFENYLAALANATPAETPSVEARKAFWINAYNALVIKGVLEAGDANSVDEVTGFFDRRRYAVMGRSLTLREIEEVMLGGDLADPRVYFVLTDGTVDGPPLPKRAYEAADLDARLSEAQRAYLTDPARNRIDRRDRRMVLSWYLAIHEEAIEDASGRPLKDYVAGALPRPIPLPTLPSWDLAFARPDRALNAAEALSG